MFASETIRHPGGRTSKVFRVGHSGSDGVFFSYFGWFPKEDLFVYVVGSNGEKEVKPAVGAVVGAVQAAAGESGQGG